ncbi:flocculation protein FLO11-like [Lytechinus variegatus]|uniref:flocculation protein FLO11-like n=1 Tax=Lytechinus variegatus TaxID=7654 RepID=UPI001BB25A9B|nr:flocculation protein FLO11-like [Lytechinus variegatus]
MRVVQNKELPSFGKMNNNNGEDFLKGGEITLVKPTVVKPAAVPEISFSLFASPEAQKALKFVNGEENEEENNNEDDCNENEVENAKEVETKSKECEEGIKSRYRWRVVARTVSACPRVGTKTQPNTNKKSTSPCRSVKTADEVAPRMRRRASLAPDHRCLSPTPPKFNRSRRMSLSPSRHPLLPNRPISPTPLANIEKTSSDSNLEMTNRTSSQEIKIESETSPPRDKPDVTGGNPAIARAISRRRFSLPITPSSQSMIPHPPSPSPRRSFPPPNSSNPSSPTSNRGNRKASVTNTLQANRQKLEALMKERSRAIANLTIGGSRESIPSPSSSMKSKQDSPAMSPAPIRANHKLIRPSLPRRSSITSETESDASHTDSFETISLLDGGEAANLDDMMADVIDMGSSPPTDVTSRKNDSPSSFSPRNLTASPLPPRNLTQSPHRLAGGRPIFKRRGFCSLDSGISFSDTSSVASEQESTTSTTNPADDELPRMSRLRNRRGTICMGSLSALVDLESRRSSSSSPCPSQTTSSQRSNDEIEEEVEDEIQKRILQRKSQLVMQAAPGSVTVSSAVSRLEARAISKTTNGRLKKIMGNLTLERTTSELLSMKAAAKRMEFDNSKKSKSLDSSD